MEVLASFLGYKINHLPTTYLGMPLENKHKELEIWDGILEKTKKKISKWKSQYPPLGGRRTLINSVLEFLVSSVIFTKRNKKGSCGD